MQPSNEVKLADLLVEVITLMDRVDLYAKGTPPGALKAALDTMTSYMVHGEMAIRTALLAPLEFAPLMRPKWRVNDGGRAAAGYQGVTGDCATRAIAIATGMDYQEVYDLVNTFCAKERKSKRRSRKSSARTGVHHATMRRIMQALGWQWVPTMQIGAGCTVHVKASELPAGRIVLSLSKHFAAMVDGVLEDTYDSSRDGTRCVYGYWIKP